jgi:hypothetical protein
MHIRQLHIQNLACFENVTFDFTDDAGKPCKWVVLLGENGAGKSTALRALVAGSQAVIQPKTHPIPVIPDLLRVLDICHIRVAVDPDTDDEGYSNGGVSWDVKIWATPNTTVPVSYLMGQIDHPQSRDAGWFFAAYRPWRGRRFIESGSEASSYAITAPREERTMSLFDDYSRMTPIREWLADLDYRRLKETGDGKKQADAIYDLAVRAIESIFPNRGVKIIEVTPTKNVILEENGVRVSIDALSDGYQSAMNWIGDLVRRLVEAFPNKKNPLHAHGVVLVDEIDLHLHPRWQRTIVNQIREVFPHLQFIVTTHSPFIAQEMTEKDKLIVLRREGDHVTVTEDKGFVQGWRVDQILTSYLFDLKETRGTAIENDEATRRELLDKQAQSSLSKQEKQTLDRVNVAIDKVKSGPEEHVSCNGAREADLGQAASDLLALLAERSTKAR